MFKVNNKTPERYNISFSIFLWCGKKQTPNYKYLLGLIKRRSRVQEKKMSCERSSNSFERERENHFQKTINQWECHYSLLQIYRESLSFAYFLRVHSNSTELSHLAWQIKHLNLKTTCHSKLKFFLWTKLLENLLLAKYLISVAATLSWTTSEEKPIQN